MRLEHTAIFAEDTIALADWYCRCFGMRVVYRNDAKPPTFFVADERGMCLEIIGRPGKPAIDDTGRVFHLAWVVDDLEKAAADLRAKGVPLEPLAGGTGVKLHYFNDPAGNRGQIIKRDKPLV